MAKILVVEDDLVSGEMIKIRLAKQGYRVLIARTGEDGIRLAQEEMPDLILMDMLLPGIHGLDATIQLKKNPQTKKIPIFALTTMNSPDFIKACYQDGICVFLRKPYDFAELLTNIQRFIPDDTATSRKVLIISDNPDLISVMKTTLKEHGFEAISAPEGMIRVDDVEKRKPDLILLDIDMLEDWGITVFKILKKSDATMSIPVVLTANQLSSDELKELVAQLGAEAYIPKSADLEGAIPELKKIFEK
ncbi:MAG: response regulator [Candidatus Aminicenantes bacterium]|jgi:CheY-like chemotaxis protein